MNMHAPVDYLPAVGNIGHDLDRDEDFLLDVDHANHLVQVLTRVRQKLLHLQVQFELVEFLHLIRNYKLTPCQAQVLRKLASSSA